MGVGKVGGKFEEFYAMMLKLSEAVHSSLAEHGGRLLGLFLPHLPEMRVLGHRQK